MRVDYSHKNVDLSLLATYTEAFFKNKGYITEKLESENRITIIVKRNEISGPICAVRIEGASNNFTIDFIWEESARKRIILGSLTTLFGGGILILRGLQLKEELEKLERDFWVYIQELIATFEKR